jgi:hypothetical protein
MRGGLLPVLVALALGACSRFPEVSAATDPAALKAPYPRLLPLDALPPIVPPPADDPAGAALAARAARLRAASGLPQG